MQQIGDSTPHAIKAECSKAHARSHSHKSSQWTTAVYVLQ